MKFFSLEDITEDRTPAPIEAGADSMEADLVEGAVISNDIDSGVRVVENTMDDASELGQHIELLRSVENNEEVSPELIQQETIAIESICARLGINYTRANLSLEGYEHATPKVRAHYLRIGCEGILNTVWEAIVNAVKKLIEWIKSFFNWIFGTNKKVSSKIEVLEQKQTEIAKAVSEPNATTETTKSATVPGDGISNVLVISKFSDYGKDEEHNIVNIVRDADKYINEKKAIVNSIQSLVTTILTVPDADYKFTFRGGKGNKLSWPSSSGFSWYTLIEVSTFELAELLPNNDLSGREAIAAAGKFKIKENRKQGKVVDLPTLSNEEITKALNFAKQLVNDIDDNEGIAKEYDSFLKESLSTIDKISERFKAVLSGKAQGDLTREVDVIKAAVKALILESIKVGTIPLKDLNTRAVALTKYVERSQKA